MSDEKFLRSEIVERENAQLLFRAIFENTFQFMGILSPDGTLIDANRAALDFVGLNVEQVIGVPFWDTPWWTNSPALQDRLKTAVAAAAKGEFVRFDAEHIDPAGKVITVDFTMTPVTDEHGKVKFLIPEGRDITERISTARILSEREARTRAIVDTAPDGIATITLAGVIESANASIHKLFKYSNGELVGKPVAQILEFFFGEDMNPQDSLKTGERKLFGVGRETTGIKKDGRKFPVEINLSLLNLGYNRIFVAVVRDITERKKSQQVQAQLAAIVEGSGDAIVGIDVEGIIASWNPAAASLYGYRSAEAVGQHVRLVVPRDRRGEMDALFDRLLNGESIGHFETVLQSKYGTLIDVELTLSPIRNSQGLVVGISTIARDISVRKEADRRIGEFYSTVSHELRTPLTSIRASLGLLEGGVGGQIDSDALQLVEIARAESDRLIRLINDILDLRKIESGKLELKLKTVRLGDMLTPLLETMKHMADEYGVRLISEHKSGDLAVMDRDRVVQVLANLISNAIKFSPKGGAVTVCVQESTDSSVRFSVSDHGPGIRPDQMHKLFGKFQQLDSSDTRSRGGTGLGLAICKAIVEEHGGQVGVDTTPGVGSTFWFELPRIELAPHSETKSQPKHSGKKRSGKAKVVIIEDDKNTLDLLARQLEPLDLICYPAPDGNTALYLIREKHPDLIILDIGIPAPDGFELVKILKSEHLEPSLLVYTSLDLSETDKTTLTLGSSRHLVKSRTSQEEFLDAVRALVDESSPEVIEGGAQNGS